MNTSSISSNVEHLADLAPEVSLRESLTRVFLRPWLFIICLLVPPILAVTLTSLIPPTYKASVKILIRYGASESAFLRDLIPENRAALSGLSSAEILRSLPSIVATVQAQNITDADIAKSAKDILSGYFSKITSIFTVDEAPSPLVSGIDLKTLRIAESLKSSLADTTGGSASTKSVEVLEKGMGSIPASQKGDELITLTVPSFNRLKVAAMANGLAESFINEYAELSAYEAHKSVVFLDKLIADTDKSDMAVRLGAQGVQRSGAATSEDVYRRSPLLERISGELASRQAELAKVASIYPANAPLVINARAAVDSLRSSLAVTEGTEVRKLAIEQLQLRRYQAANTERLFREGLVPISIVERAVEPKRASVGSKYVISGGVGLVLGLMLAIGLVVVLSIVDERIHTKSDVEVATQLPLLGILPVASEKKGVSERFISYKGELVQRGLLQLLGRLELIPRRGNGLALAITSAAAGEGKTFVVSGLAAVLARGGKQKVLLVDADFEKQSLTRKFSDPEVYGLIDLILDETPLQQAIRPTAFPGISILATGRTQRRTALGMYRSDFEAALASVRASYDFILVDTGAVLESNEAAMCGSAVDGALLIVSSGLSRRPSIRTAIAKLTKLGVPPLGIVMNRTRQIVPSFIWRNV